MKLKKFLPLKLRRKFHDQMEDLKRKFPSAMNGWPELGLEAVIPPYK